MTDNAADRKAIRKKEKAARQAEVRAGEVIRQIVSTGPGREWYWNLMVEANAMDQTFVVDNPHGTSFNEGRRSVGLSLMAKLMQWAPEQFIEMMREQTPASPSTEEESEDEPTEPDTYA